MFLILFEDKFDLELDGSVNSFLDSLVVTFIFLTSGEPQLDVGEFVSAHTLNLISGEAA